MADEQGAFGRRLGEHGHCQWPGNRQCGLQLQGLRQRHQPAFRAQCAGLRQPGHRVVKPAGDGPQWRNGHDPGWSGGANKSDDRKDVYNKLLPAKFVRLEGGSDYINLSQLAVKDLNGVNVSKGKLTKSSGVGWDGPESAAVDGVESARGHPGEYHSNGPNAWFEVDLGTPTQISTVEVYNRADCCQNRMGSGYKIKLLDENRNVFFTSDNLTGELVQTIKVQSRVFPKIDCPSDQIQAGINCYPTSLINKK